MSSDVLLAEVAFAFNRSGPVCRTAGETQKDVSDVDIKVRSHHLSDHNDSNIANFFPSVPRRKVHFRPGHRPAG